MGKKNCHMETTDGRRRTGRRRAVASTVASLAVVAGLAACEPQPPPPPRPLISVNTVAAGADANPGDGTCEATAGGGNCTFQAAIGEANALGEADIVVPDGVYPKFNPTITGNLRINWDAPRDVHVAGRWTVAEAGFLVVEGLSRHATGNTTVPAPQVAAVVPADFGIHVSGTLLARSLSLFGSDLGTLSVGLSGNAVVVESQIHTFLSTSSDLMVTIYNAGHLVMDDVVAFHPYAGGITSTTCWDDGNCRATCETDYICNGPTTVLYTEDGAQTDMRNSVIASVPEPFGCGPSGADPWVAPADCELVNSAPSCVGPVNLIGGNRIADIVVPGTCGTATIEIEEGSHGVDMPLAPSTWTDSVSAACYSFFSTQTPPAGCFPEWWTFTA